MKKYIYALFMSLCLVFPLGIQATHIVGGVIYYEHVGINRYKLIFKIYRDCSAPTGFDGDSTLRFPFYFGIFEDSTDVNLLSVTDRQLKLKGKFRVNPSIMSSCLIPNNSCVEEGTYDTIVELPRSDIGYTIIHQRCCRNSSILNIQPLPNSTSMPGITFKCYIPPSTTYPNNSAVFKKFPPIFICKDQSFYFDHSATDKDGDSLRYFLSVPLSGLDDNNPISSNQSNQDMQPINWQPPYSLSNVLGGVPSLSIDSLTGFLSCKPNKYGRFVVSILVVERRGGVAIDSVIRDFQFNVVECNIPKADMPFIPRTLNPNTNIGDYLYTFCDTFYVRFQNTSTNANGYHWNFGDPITDSFNTSKDFEPYHTYSDTGVYLVQLIAYKISGSDTCRDTTRRYVRVFPRFKVKFSGDSGCQGSPLSFSDSSTSYYGIVNKWVWDFDDGTSDTNRNPIHSFKKGGLLNVRLTVTDSKLCVDTKTLPFRIHHLPHFPNSLPNFCPGQAKTISCGITIPSPDSIQLVRWRVNSIDSFGCNYRFSIISPNIVPVHLYATSDKGCIDSTVLSLNPFPTPNPKNSPDSFFLRCFDSLQWSIFDSLALSYRWHDEKIDATRYISDTGGYYYSITYPCMSYMDSFLVYKNTLHASFSTSNVCVGDSVKTLNSSKNQLGHLIQCIWNYNRGTIDFNFEPSILFSKAGTHPINLYIEDEFQCRDTFTDFVTIYPKAQLSGSIPKLCIGVPSLIEVKPILPLPYTVKKIWWKISSSDSIFDFAMNYTSWDTSRKYAFAFVETDKGCLDSFQILLETHPIPTPLSTPDSFFIRCADSILVNISDSLALRYHWSDTSVSPIRYLDVPGLYKYQIEYPCKVYLDSFTIGNSCTLEVPTAFSPNGDGENDILYLRGFGAKKLHFFKIFNRFGQLIFMTQHQEQGWDGYYKGVLQNSDSYFYSFEAEGYKKNQLLSGEGNFLLLR